MKLTAAYHARRICLATAYGAQPGQSRRFTALHFISHAAPSIQVSQGEMLSTHQSVAHPLIDPSPGSECVVSLRIPQRPSGLSGRSAPGSRPIPFSPSIREFLLHIPLNMFEGELFYSETRVPREPERRDET